MFFLVFSHDKIRLSGEIMKEEIDLEDIKEFKERYEINPNNKLIEKEIRNLEVIS